MIAKEILAQIEGFAEKTLLHIDMLHAIGNMLESVPLPIDIEMPSVYAEKNIVLDSSVSGMTGPFSYFYVPYWRPCADFYHPSSPGKIQVILKCAQSGGSQGVAVPFAVWTVAQDPCNFMVTSANEYLSEKFVSTRFDPACESAGITKLFRPNVIRARNAKTGNTSAHKEFRGGNAFFNSVGAVDSIGKQISLKKGFFDDWSAAEVADGAQGNLYNLLQLRFNTNAFTQKQTYCSTPEMDPDPTVLLYERSDKRLWHIPCPCCGELIALEIEITSKSGLRCGLIYDKDDRNVYIRDSERYRCQLCEREWKEPLKYEAIRAGREIPTAIPIDPDIRGVRINSLYGMPWADGWGVLAKEHSEIHETGKPDVDKLKVFRNLREALPFSAEEMRADTSGLSRHIGDYNYGEVPDIFADEIGAGEIVGITIGVDCAGLDNDARLDFEIVAWTTSWQSFSILEGQLGTYSADRAIRDMPGRKKLGYNLGDGGVWAELADLINRRWPMQSGHGSMRAILTMIDGRWQGDAVRAFCQSGKVVAFPCQGDSGRTVNKLYRPGETGMQFYKSTPSEPGVYSLHPNLIKARVYKDFEVEFGNELIMPANYACFPIPADGKYSPEFFKQLNSEEPKAISDKRGRGKGFYFEKKAGVQNHKLDARCYARVGMQIAADMECGKQRTTLEDFAGKLR